MYKVYRLRYFRGGTQLSCMMYRFFPLENELLLKAPIHYQDRMDNFRVKDGIKIMDA